MTKLTELYEETINEAPRNTERLRDVLFQILVAYEDEKGYKFDEEMDVEDYKNVFMKIYNKGYRKGQEDEQIDNDHRDRPGMAGHGEPHRR